MKKAIMFLVLSATSFAQAAVLSEFQVELEGHKTEAQFLGDVRDMGKNVLIKNISVVFKDGSDYKIASRYSNDDFYNKVCEQVTGGRYPIAHRPSDDIINPFASQILAVLRLNDGRVSAELVDVEGLKQAASYEMTCTKAGDRPYVGG